MLADAKLPVTFWAEAVNTACYVQNRVLVNKSQNKTPYELFNGRAPAIGFLKPFGCHVMILNTLDNLWKFETKGDEGYFIGYSMSSKAFRVFNKRTRRIEENLHVEFLENKAIEQGAGPNWLFDIDSLTKSMNYMPVDADDTNILLRTPRQHNMYSIDLNNIVPHKDLTCLVVKASADECILWHRRLGHLNVKTMNKLVRHNLVRGLPTKSFDNDHTCTACLKGKQHKASCKSKLVNSVTKPLHTLHMDLFGHTSVSSISHKWYCLVVTDDFSRFTWTFFLRSKDDTSDILKKFITEIENLKDYKVKIIRCDNGGEFRNKEMNDFCSQKGIKREFSNARTLQQNGVAERRNRTLIEAARTMLADAKLPVTFWAEAVNTACYVQNRGAGPNWLFDIDSLTKSMNYVPVDAEPKKVSNALQDPSWVEDMQEELLQLKIQKFWTLVDCPKGPPGFQDPAYPVKVYKVEKAMYGLHQVPRAWQREDFILVQVYMDDIIFGSSNPQLCREFKALMHKKFQMSAMGELNFVLDLQVLQKEDGIFLSQDKYMGDILKKFGFSDVRSSNTSMDKENPWGKDAPGKDVELLLYRSMIGSLMYLTASRPDIMFAVCACA
nr:putative ribonuclease H-like domain-containing protein [Tanacetum cinerariifolium]